MSITDLQKPIEIEVLSDAGYKDFQFMKLTTTAGTKITTYEEMKNVALAELGKKTFDNNLSHLIIQVRLYGGAPKVCLEQIESKWKVVFNVSADIEFVTTISDYLK